MTKSILEVDSVQKKHDGKIIVSDVYLKCETKDIIGILGRNGSGKSTLLKIIFGIVTADFKFVRVDGVVKSKTSDLLNEISYLPQENFIPNLFFVKKAIGLSVANDKLQEFYEDEIIQTILNKKINQLSGGELRYLEIKLILNKNSKFVLLDEPYNGLSPIMIDKINVLVTKYSNIKGIIITDHNYENIIKISTELVLMKEGKMHHLRDRSELVEKGYLKVGMI
ncbi:ATP-binding cassette domain-containing protein [Flavobacterium xinjiangense]|uniref:ABC-type lipopolysaccharide export system, ATPase component n=1 Tax=Flavobacterium xinjiangense TaxID=178356 RepID=A0A1M7LQZ1_9FLAO|nr:ATP-binding cassette domain-containing protein [Flavobacterium xinjiangense]SHM80455.1 ABC-type lipopolysaccharide export system, ATPase component [Flavobacterium xinjiangense]